jgi:hypothetical protein
MRLTLEKISRISMYTVIFLLWNSVLKVEAHDVKTAPRTLNSWRSLNNISRSAVHEENLSGLQNKVEQSGMLMSDVLSYTEEATFYECSLEVQFISQSSD